MPHSRVRLLSDARIPVSQYRKMNVPVAMNSGMAIELRKMSKCFLIGFFMRCASSENGIKKKTQIILITCDSVFYKFS